MVISVLPELFNLRTFLSPQKETPYPSGLSPISHFLAPDNHFVSRELFCHYNLHIWIFHIRGIIQYVASVSGFFDLAKCYKDLPCCSRYQNVVPFLGLNNIPLHGYTTVCLSFVDGIWVVSTSWLF